MLASAAAKLPTGSDWTYEVKWDGYRTLALKSGNRVSLWSRNLKDATAQYGSVARTVSKLQPETILLDGEIVALDAPGSSILPVAPPSVRAHPCLLRVRCAARGRP